MAYPPRLPVKLGWHQPVVYFVAFNVAGRQRVLTNEGTFEAWRIAIGKLRTWTVLAGVMMPDHIHVLAAPRDRETPIGNFSGAMKRWMRQEVRGDAWRWQEGSFDHLLRSDESAAEKWAYIRENPVRAGLVERWEDWPYRIGFADGE